MTVARVSGEIKKPTHAVYALVSDPARQGAWDSTVESATTLHEDVAKEPAFEMSRIFANRGMRLTCRIVSADPPETFSYACTGSAGEIVREFFEFSTGKDDSSTKLTRELEYELPGLDLGVITDLTYTQAATQRSLEQSFARLNALLIGTPADPDVPPAPGETDSRSEDTGGITAEQPYSAHADSPDVPERPT